MPGYGTYWQNHEAICRQSTPVQVLMNVKTKVPFRSGM